MRYCNSTKYVGYHFMCVHVIFNAWWCNSIATGPRKYSYDLLQGLRAQEFSPLYVPIYDTSNSLLTELMVDRDTLLSKELGPLSIL